MGRWSSVLGPSRARRGWSAPARGSAPPAPTSAARAPRGSRRPGRPLVAAVRASPRVRQPALRRRATPSVHLDRAVGIAHIEQHAAGPSTMYVAVAAAVEKVLTVRGACA